MNTDEFQQYRRRKGNEVVAVRLDLDTAGFTYSKWGGTQRCKPGDWIVLNNGDTYTVDAETFESTYQEVSPGLFLKITPIWAKQSSEAGTIATKEGSTDYKQGDYIVSNDAEGRDQYAVSAEKFTKLYEPADLPK
jgi:hypothetical protein